MRQIIYFSNLDLVNVTHHILAHTLAPSYQEYQRSTAVQEEGLTNDLHKQAHDKKHFRITKCVHKLGNRLTASEVGVFSREISQLLKMRPPPLFEEPHTHRPWVYFREITVSQRSTHPSL